MKNIIVIAVLLFSFGNTAFSQKTFSSYSKELYRQQKKNDKSTFNLSKYFHESRQCFLLTLRPKQIIDTLYLVEGYDLQSGEIVSTIWCKYWKYNYRYYRQKINIINTDNYSDRLLKRTVDGKTTLPEMKIFGSISGLATKIYYDHSFKIYSQPFEE